MLAMYNTTKESTKHLYFLKNTIIRLPQIIMKSQHDEKAIKLYGKVVVDMISKSSQLFQDALIIESQNH